LSHDKFVLVELDSWFLPDTEGSAYRMAHVKSTVAVNDFDPAAQRMEYFHGQGYYRLEGEDYRGVFYLDEDDQISLQLLRRQLRLLPRRNPFERFRERFEQDLSQLMEGDLELFHAYSFATFRQFGACYELAAGYLEWLGEQGIDSFEDARRDLAAISSASKVYQFQLARAMSRRKPLDLSPIDAMGAHWAAAMDRIADRL